jgi:hypothetical protein
MDRRSARAGELDRKVKKTCACCLKKKPFRRSQWQRRELGGGWLCGDCMRIAREAEAAARPAPPTLTPGERRASRAKYVDPLPRRRRRG